MFWAFNVWLFHVISAFVTLSYMICTSHRTEFKPIHLQGPISVFISRWAMFPRTVARFRALYTKYYKPSLGPYVYLQGPLRGPTVCGIKGPSVISSNFYLVCNRKGELCPITCTSHFVEENSLASAIRHSKFDVTQ